MIAEYRWQLSTRPSLPCVTLAVEQWQFIVVDPAICRKVENTGFQSKIGSAFRLRNLSWAEGLIDKKEKSIQQDK